MYSLVGIDGNAFSVMAYVRNAMKKEGHSKESVKQYIENATSGDYDNLLVESMRVINNLNDNK